MDRLGRSVVGVFCAALAVVNGPLFLYRAWTDHVTPYGEGGRAYWALSAVVNVAIGVAGLWWVRRRNAADLRAQQRRWGRCARCGYDLRATPEKCPECGAVPGARQG